MKGCVFDKTSLLLPQASCLHSSVFSSVPPAPTLDFGPKVHNPDAQKHLPTGVYIGWVRVLFFLSSCFLTLPWYLFLESFRVESPRCHRERSRRTLRRCTRSEVRQPALVVGADRSSLHRNSRDLPLSRPHAVSPVRLAFPLRFRLRYRYTVISRSLRATQNSINKGP
jgi:hypothetical protein